LQNTLGAIVWSYVSPGVYNGTLTGAFVLNKTYLSVGSLLGSGTEAITLVWISANIITLSSFSSGVNANDILNGQGIEIRVYP